jgi:eukaryotic-like serine/threonine-protein kinase
VREPRDFKRVEELYHAALARGPDQRETFLKEACDGDEGLLHEVQSLLGYEEEGKRLLEEPAADAQTRRLAVIRGSRLGPYEISALIGAGGMGEVYRARDTRLGRDVAVKVLPEHVVKDPEALARFAREARTIAGLNHPHICALHDVGREGDIDYLVMELLEGETHRPGSEPGWDATCVERQSGRRSRLRPLVALCPPVGQRRSEANRGHGGGRRAFLLARRPLDRLLHG